MKHIILGTAGHVDHGKTTLVHKLTGVNTDRLKEETTRGITIELGFAPFTLPNGQHIGLIDVPGHEKFVKNMLAGATGIDLFMLIIAADEGVMPQTREHIDILKLLGIQKGVIALTKIDMVDEDWLELVREDVLEYINEGPFQGSPLIEVSSVTGEGIDLLLKTLENLCTSIPQRPSAGVLRLAVDRVFTMSGFGTVVTGTLWGGTIAAGQSVELLPGRKQARVRSIQVHGEKREEAFAGERVAVNLTGIDRELVERGSWLTASDVISDNKRLDIKLELLSTAPEISQRIRVHVHHGTTEILARVKLLDTDKLMPGQSCYAQLEPEKPIAALPGDRVIIRFYSPVFTIGGGTVLDPVAAKYKRRHLNDSLSRLKALDSGDQKQILLATMSKTEKLWQISDISLAMQIDEEQGINLINQLVSEKTLLALSDGYYYPLLSMNKFKKELKAWLTDYSMKWQMRFGAAKKEAQQALLPKMDSKQVRVIFKHLNDDNEFSQDELNIWNINTSPILTDAQNKLIKDILEKYDASPLTPPTWTDIVKELNISQKDQGEYLMWLQKTGKLIRVADDVHYTPKAIKEAEHILKTTHPDGYTLAQARDTLGTNRKYAMKISEYFDHIKLTYWDGEKHFWIRNDK